MGIAIFDNIFVILSINICRRCFLQQRRKVRLTLFYDGTHPSVTFPRIGGQSCRWAANDNIGNSPRAAIVVGGRAGRACIRPEARRAYGAATTRAGPAVIRRLRPSVHRSLRLSDRPSRVASRRETVGSIVTACDSDRRRAMCWQLAVLPQWDVLDTWLRLVYYSNAKMARIIHTVRLWFCSFSSYQNQYPLSRHFHWSFLHSNLSLRTQMVYVKRFVIIPNKVGLTESR